MIKKLYLALILILINSSLAYSQLQFRIMTYNILNYPSKIVSVRNPYFKKIINEINPDIIVVQEVESITGVTIFHEQVLDTAYAAGGFIDGFDTDNAVFFKKSLFNFLSNKPILTSLRNISQFTFQHKLSGDSLIIFSVHLKATDSETDRQKRLNEVTKLREVTDKLPLNSQYIVVGDFNIYYADEPAFRALIDQSKPGYFIDPINRLGYWNNSAIFSDIHTQSTRTTSLADEGSTGGLDDRFDMILISQSVKDSGLVTYLPNSYTTFGNDGIHFNKQINAMPNNSVSAEIANALYYASDHLPVYADFEIQGVTSVKLDEEITNDFALYQNYPNPFNPVTNIRVKLDKNYFGKLKVYDILGNEIETLVDEELPAGVHEFNFKGNKLSSGTYFYTLFIGNKIITKKMILIE